jgi:phosphoglycerate kinase
MTVLTMHEVDLNGKRVMIREDLNVPLKDGVIVNDARIKAAMVSIKFALESGARVILMSHLGRPEEGLAIAEQPGFSLLPVAVRLSQLLNQSVELMSSDFSEEDSLALKPGSCVLLENVRINSGEKNNDEDLSQYYASLCDVFVMDAFGTAHRSQASTLGVAKYAAIACAGPLLVSELEALGRALHKPARPMLAIVGGAKVSSKLQVLVALSKQVDHLIVGGGIANTFLAAAGYSVGNSLYEKDMLGCAREIMEQTTIQLPQDVVVATEFSESSTAITKPVSEVTEDDMILDIGPDTCAGFVEIIAAARTILWNGPIGVFEFEQFAGGTEAVARAIAKNTGFSIAGGGETISAIEKYQISDKVSYISTGGGAFLEFVQGVEFPAVQVLERQP